MFQTDPNGKPSVFYIPSTAGGIHQQASSRKAAEAGACQVQWRPVRATRRLGGHGNPQKKEQAICLNLFGVGLHMVLAGNINPKTVWG